MSGEPEAADQVVEQVVAAVGPQGHLPLAVVDGVQCPPPAQRVRQAVAPVFGEVEEQQVDEETRAAASFPAPEPGLRAAAG
jgi:hypothetical protein